MLTEQARPFTSYQVVLRIIGAYLDEQEACTVSLIEGPEAISVRFHREDGNRRSGLVNFRYAEFETLELEARRRNRGRCSSDTTVSYEDRFRAIGYELDQVAARKVQVDDDGANVHIRYLYVHDTAEYVVQQRSAALGWIELQRIGRLARERRRTSRKPVLMKFRTSLEGSMPERN